MYENTGFPLKLCQEKGRYLYLYFLSFGEFFRTSVQKKMEKWTKAIFHDWKNYDIDTNTDNEGLFVKNLKDRRRVHAKTQIGSFSVECNLKDKKGSFLLTFGS